MTEREAIDMAHGQAVQKLYAMLLDAITQATNDQQREQAEQRFLKGLALARAAQDRARALIEG